MININFIPMYKIQKRKSRIIFFKKKLAKLVCVSILAMFFIVSQAQLFNAFEAHIINVTAEIVNDVPSIDPPSGEFCNDGSLVVTLSSTLTGTTTTIYYTIDGSDPDCYAPNGSLYSGSFPLIYSATVKARTCHERDGELLQSAIMSETYDVSAVYCDSFCGDGIVDPGEQCDDGNMIDGDGCDSGCLIEQCGPCDGKITSLTMQYNSTSTAVIKVVQKNDGETVFNSTVNPGEQFSFVGTWGVHPTLGTEIIIYVDDVEHIQIHTSCSAPVGPGMIFNDFLIITGESRNGGPLCPGVVLNEFLPNPIDDDAAAMPDGEWVELYNLSAIYSVDLSGYYLTDDEGNRIDVESCRTNTGGVMIRPNDFLVVYRKGEGDSCTSHNFSLNNDNDTINFFDYNDNPLDSYAYDGSDYDSLTPTPDDPNYDDSAGSGSSLVPENKSYARIPDGTGEWVDPIPTPAAPNMLEEYTTEDQDFSAGSSSVSTGASEELGAVPKSAAAGPLAGDSSETGEGNPTDDTDDQTANNSGQINGDETEDETDEDKGDGADKDGEEDDDDIAETGDGDAYDDSDDSVDDDGGEDDSGQDGGTQDEGADDDAGAATTETSASDDSGDTAETGDSGADESDSADTSSQDSGADDSDETGDTNDETGASDSSSEIGGSDGLDNTVDSDREPADEGDPADTSGQDGGTQDEATDDGGADAGDAGDPTTASGQDDGADIGAGGDQDDQEIGTDDICADGADSADEPADTGGQDSGEKASSNDSPDNASDTSGGDNNTEQV
ncbi:DUF4215 domain-containing protein [Candidatus Parcubacteria bacterium]|nr:DUF4215 domain-containing protein [Candidatus Parcubacteria bacterium]